MLTCFFCVDFVPPWQHISHLRWRTSSRNQLCGVFYANAGGYSSCILHSHGHSINLNGGSKLCLLWLDLCCLCVQSQISTFLHLAHRGKPKKGSHLHIYIYIPNISNQTNVIAFSLILIKAGQHRSVFRKLEKVEQVTVLQKWTCLPKYLEASWSLAQRNIDALQFCSGSCDLPCMPRLVLKESVQKEVMGFQMCVTVSICFCK